MIKSNVNRNVENRIETNHSNVTRWDKTYSIKNSGKTDLNYERNPHSTP